MLALRFIRENEKKVKESLRKRGMKLDIDHLLELDGKHRQLLQEVEKLRYERNRTSNEIGKLKQKGEDAGKLLEQMKTVSQKIHVLDSEVKEISAIIHSLSLLVPNIVDESVPKGKGPQDNVEVR